MSGSSRLSRALTAEVSEIERRLRSLEKGLESVGVRIPVAAGAARNGLAGNGLGASTFGGGLGSGGLGEAIASALGGLADRFRRRAGALGGQSASIGKDAAKLGSGALSKVSAGTEAHPLFALVVAVGVGVLIGMASRGWD